MFSDVARPTETLPKLAEAGSIHVVEFADTDRFSRPPPCRVGPTACVPVVESLTTKSARLTSADLICAGDQSGCRSKSTASDPAMCGVDIEVPCKNAKAASVAVRIVVKGSPFPTHVNELRTFTPTELMSGLIARSTLVGPWLLKPARMSLFSG